MADDKVQKLTKYAEHIKQRLNSAVPERHTHRPQVFKDMLKLDLKKTIAKIEKLK